MKDVSDMFHVNLNAVYAQHKVDVWASCFCTHVPQQDLILLRTPYCRHAEKKKKPNNKLNMSSLSSSSCLISLFTF